MFQVIGKRYNRIMGTSKPGFSYCPTFMAAITPWQALFLVQVVLCELTKSGCRNGAVTWAECSGGAGRSRGRPGASQSFGLRRQASWLKVWRGGGCKFNATERAHKRTGGQVVAEWRLTGLVTPWQAPGKFGTKER